MVGFDYRIDQQVNRPKMWWKNELSAVLKAGGSRKVRSGETFAKDKNGTLLFEVYANVEAS